MSNFEETFAELQKAKEELESKYSVHRAEAIKYVQDVVDAFRITSAEVALIDQIEREVSTGKRTPARIKYRLPNGVEWTGKGIMKKEVKAYLDENGLTKEDLKDFEV